MADAEGTFDDLAAVTGETATRPAGIPRARSNGAANPPPRAAASDRAPRTTGGPRKGSLESRLGEFLRFNSGMISFINETDGSILYAHSDSLAKAYAKLAEENSRVKRVLEGLMEGGAWGAAVMATAMCALPIAANHNAIPPNVMEKIAPFVASTPPADSNT